MRELIGWVFAGLLFFAAGASAGAADAEVSEVRISKGYGILYLPLIVMEDRKLLEKKAAEAGLGDIKITWYLLMAATRCESENDRSVPRRLR
jgi:ABC-type nitrate/sulfonate/bicarbonate transport system substrate-binding protein